MVDAYHVVAAYEHPGLFDQSGGEFDGNTVGLFGIQHHVDEIHDYTGVIQPSN